MDGARFGIFLRVFAAALAAAVLGIGGFNYCVDPLQYYRIPSFYRPVYFSGMQRFQNAGLARTQAYDTVVIGSSLMENFLPSHINHAWGARALKLAISGSTAHEQFLVLRQALRTGQVKHVIWGLDAPVFYRAWDAVRDDQAPFPYFMYRSPPFANIEYLFSLDTLRLSVTVLRGYGEPILERIDTWHERAKYGREEVLKAWHHGCEAFKGKFDGRAAPMPSTQDSQMLETLDRNVVRLVREYPATTFHLFFPPVSVLAYLPANGGWLPYVVPFDRAVAERLVDQPNVRIFDFQTDTRTTHDFALYKDPIHFHLSVSERVVEAMREGAYRMRSRQDIERNLGRLIEDVNGYDPCASGAWPAQSAAPQPARLGS